MIRNRFELEVSRGKSEKNKIDMLYYIMYI